MFKEKKTPDQQCDRFDLKYCTFFTPLPEDIKKKTGVAFFSIFRDQIYFISRAGYQLCKMDCEFPVSMAQPTICSLTFVDGKMYVPDYTRDQYAILNGVNPNDIKKAGHDLDVTQFFTVNKHIFYSSMEQDDNKFRVYDIDGEREEQKFFDARYYNFPIGIPEPLIVKNDQNALYKVEKDGENFKDTKLIDFVCMQSPVNFTGIMMFWGTEEVYYNRFVVINCFWDTKIISKGEGQTIMTDRLHQVAQINDYGLQFPKDMILKWYGEDFIPKRDAALKEFYDYHWNHKNFQRDLIVQQIKHGFAVEEFKNKMKDTYNCAVENAKKAEEVSTSLETKMNELIKAFNTIIGV